MRTKLGMGLAVIALFATGVGMAAGATLRHPTVLLRPAADSTLLHSEAASLASAEARLAAIPGDEGALSGVKSQLDALKSQLDTTSANGPDAPAVTVLGTGQVLDTPDVLTVSVGVSSQQATPALALAAANAGTQRIIDTLHANGVADRDIQTQFVSFSRAWQPSGWQAGNQLTVKLRDMTHAGQTLAAAASAGGNDADFWGVSFDFQDNTRLLGGARAAAMADARTQAQDFANAAGRHLGSVRTITEQVSSNPTPQPCCVGSSGAAAGGAGGVGAPPVPIQPGQTGVFVVVLVVYDLV